MKKVTDLSPKMRIPTSEQELIVPPGTPMMGDKVGGVSAFSDAFKRGYGDQVFGSDRNGIWLGAADFENAPFSVDMDGNVNADSIKLASSTFVNAAGGFNQNFTSGTPSDVTGSSFSVTITGQPKIVLIVVNCSGWVNLNSGGTPYAGYGFVTLTINGSQVRATNISGGNSGTDVTGYGTGAFAPIGAGGLNYLASLGAGTHTIKLRGGCNQVVGSSLFTLYSYELAYLTIGNA